MSPDPEVVYITRKVSFCAAHRYHNPRWSDAKNREVFGPCNNPFGHGHNYELEVTIGGGVHPETGMVLNLTIVDTILQEQVVEVLDHRFINEEVDAFRDINPTTENLVVFIWQRVEAALSHAGAKLHSVRLYESPTLYAEYFGEE